MHFTIYCFIIGILILYGLFICAAVVGWIRNSALTDPATNYISDCSIIVAVRNEYNNLDNLITCILKQNNFPAKWELILVDDHSEDGSVEIISRYAEEHANIRAFRLDTDQFGKKAAIAQGLKHSRYNIVVQTDADCHFHAGWLGALLRPFVSGADLAIGPVQYVPADGLLNSIFRLEFLSMVISGGGMANVGKPVFCNAANMAYRRDIAQNLVQESKSASGDDVFLLHAFKRAGRNIQFVKDREAIVRTDAPANIRAFINQRIRWGSKAKYYTDIETILLSLLVATINIALVSIFVGVLLFGCWEYFAVLLGVKMIADMVLFSVSLPFFDEGILLFYVPIMSIIYPFYIAFASIYSIFAHYEWKGRRHF